MMEVEFRVVAAINQGMQVLPKLGKARNRFSPRASRRNGAADPSQDSDFQNC
jgi:hypothetical protein